MCGIFGYIGPRNCLKTTIDGLKRLEYRGYDSAGIAGIEDGVIRYAKEVGKIAALEKEVEKEKWELDLAIAQTRWATHGKPSKRNAHPHFNSDYSLALVHNGIIENHEVLRQALKTQGIEFTSDTDTEVVAHLIGTFYEGDLIQAVRKAMPLLKGSYALSIIHRDFPDLIIAIAHDCPLVIGLGKGETFISSDANAFSPFTREVIFLENGELAVVKKEGPEVYDTALVKLIKKPTTLTYKTEDSHKGRFEHYTLKEIHEQPTTIHYAMQGRTVDEYGTAAFEGVDFDLSAFQDIQRILILACGTSWHAGYVAAYMIEDKARIPVQVEISSEFRYKNPIVPPGTLTIAISQSGETADTIAAVREVKAKGGRVLALCNVQGSTLVREADMTIFLRAGAEIGVCSTKAFTSQVVVLALFTLMLARTRHMDKTEGQRFLKALQLLPEQVQSILDNSPHIEQIAKKYAQYKNFFFIGRRYMYPTSLEGALKLKEISYINANGYPAGEMKHGPIALINEECPTVALCANHMTYDKLLSNLMEVKARSGKVIAIAEENEQGLNTIADDIIRVPSTTDELSAIPTTVVTQLLAYYIAKELGADIDQPRNLAKSVTVE